MTTEIVNVNVNKHGIKHRATKSRREQVHAMAACGVTQTDIAKTLAIDKKTLRKHYRVELDTAAIKASAVIAQKLYKKAMNGNLKAMMFWLKSRAGWTEKVEHEHGGIIGTADVTQGADFTDPLEAQRYYKQLMKDLKY